MYNHMINSLTNSSADAAHESAKAGVSSNNSKTKSSKGKKDKQANSKHSLSQQTKGTSMSKVSNYSSNIQQDQYDMRSQMYQLTYQDLINAKYNQFVQSQQSSGGRKSAGASSSLLSASQGLGYQNQQSSSNSNTQSDSSHQQQHSNQNRRGGKQGKKQQNIDIINANTINQKEFRVFYGLISTQDDFASPIHCKKIQDNSSKKQQSILEQKVTPNEQFKAENNSINNEQEKDFGQNEMPSDDKQEDDQDNDSKEESLVKIQSEAIDDEQAQNIIESRSNSIFDLFAIPKQGSTSSNQLIKSNSAYSSNIDGTFLENSFKSSESYLNGLMKQPEENKHFDRLREWFINLSLDERVNALTTTSPYLSEVLLNMKKQIARKGPTLFAQQTGGNQSKYGNQSIISSYLQKSDYQTFMFGDQQYMYRIPRGNLSSQMNQHYSQGYSPQYFMGDSNQKASYNNNTELFQSLYESERQKRGEAHGINYSGQQDYDDRYGGGSSTILDRFDSYPKGFEECFYCRQQTKTEIERFMIEEPQKYLGYNYLFNSIRFNDLLMYADTISVTHEIIEDPQALFGALNSASGGQAFQNPCQFQYDSKLGMHLIDHPNWFLPERFQSFASWIAAIFEENLWANYNYWVSKNSTGSSKNNNNGMNLSYLFDTKEIQGSMSHMADPITSFKIHSLANTWLTANQAQKQKIIDKLKDDVGYENPSSSSKAAKKMKNAEKHGQMCRELIPSHEIQNSYIILNGFFYVDQAQIHLKQLDLIINENQLNDLIQQSLRLQKSNAESQNNTKKGQNKKKKPKNGQSLYEFNTEDNHPQYKEAFDFIMSLTQSDIQSVEKGEDITKRTLFKLIQQMHQDLVIHELLSNENGKGENGSYFEGSFMSSHKESARNSAWKKQGQGPSQAQTATKNKKKKKKQNKKTNVENETKIEKDNAVEADEIMNQNSDSNDVANKFQDINDNNSNQDDNNERKPHNEDGDGKISEQNIIIGQDENKPLDQIDYQNNSLPNIDNITHDNSDRQQQNIIKQNQIQLDESDKQKRINDQLQNQNNQSDQIDQENKMKLQNSSLRVQEIVINQDNSLNTSNGSSDRDQDAHSNRDADTIDTPEFNNISKMTDLKEQFQEEIRNPLTSSRNCLASSTQQDDAKPKLGAFELQGSEKHDNLSDECDFESSHNEYIENLNQAEDNTDDLNHNHHSMLATHFQNNQQSFLDKNQSNVHDQSIHIQSIEQQNNPETSKNYKNILQSEILENSKEMNKEEAPLLKKDKNIQQKDSSAIQSTPPIFSPSTKKKEGLSQQMSADSDMKRVSNNYVTDMLEKIGNENNIEEQKVSEFPAGPDCSDSNSNIDAQQEEPIQQDSNNRPTRTTKNQKRKRKNIAQRDQKESNEIAWHDNADVVDMQFDENQESQETQSNNQITFKSLERNSSETESSQSQTNLPEQTLQTTDKRSKKGFKRQNNKLKVDINQVDPIIIQKNSIQTSLPQNALRLTDQDSSSLDANALKKEGSSSVQSRNASPSDEVSDASKTQGKDQNKQAAAAGRKRNRKKAKGNIDHQEAMNQFIKQFQQKKDDNYDKYGGGERHAGGKNKNTQGTKGKNRKNDMHFQKQSSFISGTGGYEAQQIQLKKNPQSQIYQTQSENLNESQNENQMATGLYNKKFQNQKIKKMQSYKEENKEFGQNTYKKDFSKQSNKTPNLYQEKLIYGGDLQQVSEVANEQSQMLAYDAKQNSQMTKQKKKLMKSNNQVNSNQMPEDGQQNQQIEIAPSKVRGEMDKTKGLNSDEISRQEIIDAFNVSNSYTIKRKQQKQDDKQTQKQESPQKQSESNEITVTKSKDEVENEKHNKISFQDAQQSQTASQELDVKQDNLGEIFDDNSKSQPQVPPTTEQTSQNNQINPNSPSFKPSQTFAPQNQFYPTNSNYNSSFNRGKMKQFNIQPQATKSNSFVMGAGNFFNKSQYSNSYVDASGANSFVNEGERQSHDVKRNFPPRYNRDSNIQQHYYPDVSNSAQGGSGGVSAHHLSQTSQASYGNQQFNPQYDNKQKKFKPRKQFSQEIEGDFNQDGSYSSYQYNWRQQSHKMTNKLNKQKEDHLMNQSQQSQENQNIEPKQIKLTEQADLGVSDLQPTDISNKDRLVDSQKQLTQQMNNLNIDSNYQHQMNYGLNSNGRFNKHTNKSKVNQGDFSNRLHAPNIHDRSAHGSNSSQRNSSNVQSNHLAQQQHIYMPKPALQPMNQHESNVVEAGQTKESEEQRQENVLYEIINDQGNNESNIQSQERNISVPMSLQQKMSIMESANEIQNGIQNIINNATSKIPQVVPNEEDDTQPQEAAELQTQDPSQTTANDPSNNETVSKDQQETSQRENERETSRRGDERQGDQFLINPSQLGQISGQISHINQTNQYNINSFGNLNIGSISSNNFSSNSNNSAGMQNINQLPQFQNMAGTVQNIQNMPNMINQINRQHSSSIYNQPNNGGSSFTDINSIQSLQHTQSQRMPQLQNQNLMVGGAPSNGGSVSQFVSMVPAVQQMQQLGSLGAVSGIQQPQQYPPQQYFDYNLLQNIEYKFYEKFDNDIYDEVNKIQKQLDLTKDERNFVLQKLQAMCEEVFKRDNEDDKSSLSPKKNISNESKSSQTLTPQIKQFGSLVTGLALESSDMDMAVTNLILPDREKMIESLDLFAEKIENWERISNLKAISTASIPVIKAVVDLNLLREKEMDTIKTEKNDQKQKSQKDFGLTQTDVSQEEIDQEMISQEQHIKQQKIPDHLAKLKIDITFDDNLDNDSEDPDIVIGLGASSNNNIAAGGFTGGFNGIFGGQPGFGFTPPHYSLAKSHSSFSTTLEHKSHQGLASCKLLKNYVENYKCLKEVAIVLKQFLARMDLNQPYHGGLSSYSTVLLLVAYMNRWDLKMSATLTPARLLMGFLDYYSYYFKVSMFGIDVSNGGSFYEHSSPESLFVILDPLNQQNNTTKSSFLTHEIIKSFRRAFNKLKNLLLQYQQFQNLNITENLLDVILERDQPPQNEIQSTDLQQQQQIPQMQQNIGNQQPSITADSQNQQQNSGQQQTSIASVGLNGCDINESSQRRSSSQENTSNQSMQQAQQAQQPIQIQIQQIQQIQILQQLQQ